MKHLANCTNTELLKQSVQIRPLLREWLQRTGIPAIRARRPEGLGSPEGKDGEWSQAQREALIAQGRANTRDIIDAALTNDFEGTVELLCMATFTPRERFDDNPLSDYIAAINEIMRSDEVSGFFTLYL